MENNIVKNTPNQRLEIYQNADGSIKVEVKVDDETVWLSLNQIAEIFARDKSVISRHLRNIYKSKELEKKSTVANFATVQIEGEREIERHIEYYNLDMIISVGYRVNSKQGIQFRRWASNILKEYLIKGYSINQEKVAQDKLKALTKTVELLSNTLINQNLVSETGIEILSLIRDYAKTWDVLIKYDEERLDLPTNLHIKEGQIVTYRQAIDAIKSFKNELAKEGTQTNLFGLERDKALESILANIEQTYDGKDLYVSVEEKAAHLLYFLIKDHPFSDGNKRIGSLLFLLYISSTKMGLKIPNPNSMISLALLVAESNPSQKEVMIKLIMHLITMNINNND